MQKQIPCELCGQLVVVHPNAHRVYCEECRQSIYQSNTSLRASANYRLKLHQQSLSPYYHNIDKYKSAIARFEHQEQILNNLDQLFRCKSKREYTFTDLISPLSKRKLKFDAYYPDLNIAVEVNGQQHYKPVRFGGCSVEEAEQITRRTQICDRAKQAYCLKHNIKLLIIPFTITVDTLADCIDYQLSRKGKTYITKCFKFAYAHKLENNALSDEDNSIIFGKCNNAHYHGHNARLMVKLGGVVDPLTGMLVNFKDIKTIVNSILDEEFDHKNLNQDTDEFVYFTSTCENTLQVLWQRLIVELPTLLELTMYEEDDSFCIYRGGQD